MHQGNEGGSLAYPKIRWRPPGAAYRGGADADVASTHNAHNFIVPEVALVQPLSADSYVGTRKRRGWPWTSWSAWKSCSRVDTFDREVILLCVQWYLRFKLSLQDLVEMIAERGLSLAHTTIMRWMQHYILGTAVHRQKNLALDSQA